MKGNKKQFLEYKNKKTHRLLRHFNEEIIMLKGPELIDDILHADIIKLDLPF